MSSRRLLSCTGRWVADGRTERVLPGSAGKVPVFSGWKEDFMIKRMILMLMLTAAVVVALGFVKFQQIQEAIAQGKAYQPPPEAVTTIVARQEMWPTTLTAIG